MAEYCAPEDLGRHGVNAKAIEDLSVDEQQTPPIQAASDLIDSYLRKVFTLPLVSWGSEIRQAAAVIAAWTILRVRGIKPGENPEDNALYLEYKRVLEWLKMVAAGTVVPEVTDSGGAPSTGSSTMTPLIFSNASRGYQVDTESGDSPLPFQGGRR